MRMLAFKGKAYSLAFVVLSGGVCAQAPVSDLTSQSINGQSSELNQSVGSMEERVAVLERIVQSRTALQQRVQQQLDTMQGEVDELRGAIELHANQLEKVLQRQRELYLEIDKRVESLKAQTPSVPEAAVTQDPTPITTAATSLSESEAYEAAVNLILKTREYDKAIPAFEAFLQGYPQSKLADNAHYWLGQLLFNKQQWANASESFNTVVSNFAQSTKRPDAMLKLGIIAQRTGKNAEARSWFEKVVSEYPNSSAAKLANSRL